MKFQIKRKILLDALSKVSRAVSLKSPLPVLTGIKFDLTDTSLTLTGSDSDITIVTTISDDIQIESKGSIVLSSKYILEIVKKIESEDITFELTDGFLTRITGGRSVFQLNGTSSFDYPRVDVSRKGIHFTMKSHILKQLIDKTSYATSEQETRPILTGVNFKCSDSQLLCIATDSYRLSQNIVSIDDDVTFNVVIPKKSLIELTHIIEKDENIEVYVSNRRVLFEINDYKVVSRLIDGTFPDTSRLIENHYDYIMSIKSSALTGAISRVSLLSEETRLIKLDMSEDTIILSAQSKEIGNVKENLSTAFYKGDHLEISFSATYLSDAIRSINSDVIQILFNGSMKPFIVKDAEKKDNIQVILPVRQYE